MKDISIIMSRKNFLYVVFVLNSIFLFAQKDETVTNNQNFKLHYENAQNESKDLSFRIVEVKKAIEIAKTKKSDSVLLKAKRLLTTLYLKEFSVDSLFDLNHENLKLAKKLNDTLALGHITNVLGWYHKYNNSSDSAYYYYYNASKYFYSQSEKAMAAGARFEMADLQFEERDYVGCENNAFEAIRIYQTLPENDYILDNLWALHNLVAIASDELKQFDKSIEYHNKALNYSDKIDDNFLYTLYSNSNIALIYKELKQYDKAFEIYKNLFQNESVLKQELNNYALILGDYALLRHLMGAFSDEAIQKDLNRAYKISDSIQDEAAMMSVALNLSEYYLDKKELDSSLKYADVSYNIGRATSTNDVVLNALKLKSNIENDERAATYLNEYIKLNDSLVNKERSIRNKFARIEFETDEIERENERISRERLWLLGLSGILIITLILLYIIISQRARNKQLKLIQQQQEANEEIYNLMLSQQDKIDEARTIEKKRISEELHDGILGRLFGTRLSLDSLNMVSTPEAIKTRENYIVELKNIEQEIRKVSHELNTDFVSGSGFEDIIATLVETQTLAYGLDYSINTDDDIIWEDLPNKTKIHIYRIIQESLQNIYKHAQATHVDISFKLKNNVICLLITDNGSGFDVDKTRKGIGIKNMNSRVGEIGGEVQLTSEKNVGTSILITIPI